MPSAFRSGHLSLCKELRNDRERERERVDVKDFKRILQVDEGVRENISPLIGGSELIGGILSEKARG